MPPSSSSSRTAAADAPADVSAHTPRVEVGWVLAGPLDAVDTQAVQEARRRMLAFLTERFPAFDWDMPLVWHKELTPAQHTDPVVLLDAGVAERDVKDWDFVLVVTAADLTSYFKPFTLGTPAHAIDAAVLSTARLDPVTVSSTVDEQERSEAIARRLVALGLHLFGHLNDLPHSGDPHDVMYDLKTVDDLDAMQRLSDGAAVQLRKELRAVADLRLEEQGQQPRGHWRFYLRAFWLNRRDIWKGVLRIRPWQFPLRFSRLSTAAVSTMLILVMTAEVWDLGMSQPPGLVALLSLTALLGTSSYLVRRQQLLHRRRRRRLREQRVIGHASITLAVGLGMLTAYALLFLASLLIGLLFFNLALIREWAAAVEAPIGLTHHLVLSGFIASLGLVIGALGASFEEQTYFRHVAFVDEET